MSNICQAQLVFGDAPVVAAIPVALEGVAKKWFRSLNLSSEQSSDLATVDGWIQRLEDAFAVNRLETKNKAKNRKYDPTTDNSITEYIFDKVELLKASNRSISERDIIDEIWLGLPGDLQILFDENEVLSQYTLQRLQRDLINKDRSYRLIQTQKSKSYDKPNRNDTSSNPWKPRNYKPGKFANWSKERNRDWKGKGKEEHSSEGRNLKETMDKSADKKVEKLKRDTGRKSENRYKDKYSGLKMTRPCRHCGRNHFDFDCPLARSESYFEQIASASNNSDTSETTTESSDSEGQEDQRESSGGPASSFHTTTNGQR